MLHGGGCSEEKDDSGGCMVLMVRRTVNKIISVGMLKLFVKVWSCILLFHLIYTSKYLVRKNCLKYK